MIPILDGIRVLDFGRYIAGPFCAAMLADLGAEVIRVERPGGGDDRYLMPIAPDAVGAMFLQANRGKKSLTLDIASSEAAPVLKRLIGSADVVVANFSAGALRHFGLDYATLSAIRPDIILTTIGAYDADSAQADAVGFDGVGQALSGAIHLTGEPGRPYRSATSYVDYSTAISAAFGTLGAIIRRMKTGKGSHVEATLVGTALTIMNPVLIEQETGANAREPIANRSPIAGPSDMFAARDGWFIMQVIGQGMFRRWVAMVDRPDLLEDARFADDISRGRNGAALSAIMAEWAAPRSRADCLAAIAASNIGASPVLTPADVVAGEMGLRDTYFQAVEYPGAGEMQMVNPLTTVGPEAPRRLVRAPVLGEHTEAILAGLGYSEAEQDGLAAAGLT